jgi:hypothetical protein
MYKITLESDYELETFETSSWFYAWLKYRKFSKIAKNSKGKKACYYKRKSTLVFNKKFRFKYEAEEKLCEQRMKYPECNYIITDDLNPGLKIFSKEFILIKWTYNNKVYKEDSTT